MTVVESPTRGDGTSHIHLSRREFERRLAAGGHEAEEIDRLWAQLASVGSERAESTRTLGLGPDIAIYLGLLLVVAASVSVLGVYWNGLGAPGVLALGAALLVGYLVASEIMRRRGLTQPADVLETVAIGWLGVVTYAVERLAGLWPEGASHIGHVHWGLTTIAVAGLTGARFLQAFRPAPLLFVPMALATGVLAVDLAELVFGNDLSDRQRVIFVLPVGLVWLAIGFWLDVTRRRGWATWAHWVGLAAASGATVVLVPKTVPGFALIGMLGATALFFSAFVRHWSFTVIGAIGVLMATVSAIGMLQGIAPFVIAAVGLALIVVGLRWSRWQETIRAAVLTRMPVAARAFVERLGP